MNEENQKPSEQPIEPEPKKSEEQIVDEILKEQVKEGRKVFKDEAERKFQEKMATREERMQQRIDNFGKRREQKTLSAAKKRLQKNVRKAQERKFKIRSRFLAENKLTDMSSEEARKVTESFLSGAPKILKITPDMERILFPYYIAGASLRSIWQQFGEKMDFSLQTIASAKDFYLWDQRRAAIRNKVMQGIDGQIVSRMKDYALFLDDLLSEAIIRFKDNSGKGDNKSPFNTLKITNIKDIKDTVELLMNMYHGGVKKVSLLNEGGVNVNVKMDDKKAAKILSILAEDEEDMEEIAKETNEKHGVEESIEAEYEEVEETQEEEPSEEEEK